MVAFLFAAVIACVAQNPKLPGSYAGLEKTVFLSVDVKDYPLQLAATIKGNVETKFRLKLNLHGFTLRTDRIKPDELLYTAEIRLLISPSAVDPNLFCIFSTIRRVAFLPNKTGDLSINNGPRVSLAFIPVHIEEKNTRSLDAIANYSERFAEQFIAAHLQDNEIP